MLPRGAEAKSGRGTEKESRLGRVRVGGRIFTLRQTRKGADGGRNGESGDGAFGERACVCENVATSGGRGAQTGKSKGRPAGSGANRGDLGCQAYVGVDTSLSSSAA